MKMLTFARMFKLCFLVVLGLDSIFCELQQLEENAFYPFLSSNPLVLVLFKSSGDCADCSKAADFLEQVPQPDLVQTEIVKATTDAVSLADKYGVTSFPALVFYRNSYPALYHGQLQSEDDISELLDWLTQASDVATKDLFDSSFEHLTQATSGATTGDWFVVFYKPDDEECLKILPSVENTAVRVKQRMSVAKVDVTVNTNLAERFNIQSVPDAILFKQGKMYRYEPGKFDPQSMVAFVDSWYKNVKASSIPMEPTAFDRLTESIAMAIKSQVNDPNKKWMFVAMVTGACLLIVALVICVFRKPSDPRTKQD